MRMSCNGCRVLRKGCSDACTIRPCLQWIKTPEAQAHATVFLAKFYGRAGLLNLLSAPGPGADHLRPEVFRSLLYEACGRIVNPVFGSVGLLWSGQWQACQAAVEAVLTGEPVVRIPSSDQSEATATPPLGTRAACDIRHVAKVRDAADLNRVSRAGRTKFKRASSFSTTSRTKVAAATDKPDGRRTSPRPSTLTQEQEAEPVTIAGSVDEHEDTRALSHHDHQESAGSHHHLDAAQEESSEDTEAEAGSHVSQAEDLHSHVQASLHDEDEEEVRLELTLGLEPVVVRQTRSLNCDLRGLSAASSLMGLRLHLSA